MNHKCCFFVVKVNLLTTDGKISMFPCALHFLLAHGPIIDTFAHIGQFIVVFFEVFLI